MLGVLPPVRPPRWLIEALPVAVACTTELDATKDVSVDAQVCVCSECGVIQTSKAFDTSAYETPQFFSVGGVWAEHRARLAEFIDASLPAGCPTIEAALEIGPSASPILRAVRRPIVRAHYFDLMRDLPFALQPHERYEKQPFPPVTAAGQFDLIVASHVLEHAPSVFDFLSAVKRSLAPNGVGVLSLPNFTEWFGRKYWNAISCEHLTYPFAGHLAQLCERVGLRVEFDFAHFARHARVRSERCSAATTNRRRRFTRSMTDPNIRARPRVERRQRDQRRSPSASHLAVPAYLPRHRQRALTTGCGGQRPTELAAR